MLPLTEAKIKALKPKSKGYKKADFEGLYVYITPSGSRIWRMKFRHNKKEGSLTIGEYPAVTLKEAREEKRKARALLAKGINPSTAKAKAKQVEKDHAKNSFSLIADRFIDKSRKEGNAHATLKKLEWLLADARADFGTTPINDITPQIVLKTLRKREKLGQYETARRMRSRIGGVFRYAVASGLCENDPTFSLRGALIRPTVKHRAAITDPDTLGRFLKALENYQGQRATIIALWLLILFAARPGELRKAHWKEFDLEKRVWNVPAERMKMRRAHTVPLSDKALELLAELKGLTGWGGATFPCSDQRP